MNKLTFITLLIALSGAAFAESPTPEDTSFVTKKSRVEVEAELADFKRSGAPNPHSIYTNHGMRAKSTRNRAEVIAEAISARDSGELYAMTGEDSGTAYLAQQYAKLRRVPSATILAQDAAKR